MTVTIAQITDVHLGFERGRDPEPNAERLGAVLRTVAALEPAAVFVTGDLTEGGAVADYRQLADALAVLEMPVYLTVGNHDDRAGFASVFAMPRTGAGHVQFAVDVGDLRCVILDTLDAGRHAGTLCAERLEWLERTLAAAPDRPTLLMQHHPPVAVGIPWMDPAPDAPWIVSLRSTVARHPQVLGIATGHVHGASSSCWHGLPVLVAPSVAPGVALATRAIDPARPDNRAMIVDSAPGFALHRWHAGQLTTHFATAEPPVLARYDQALQPLVAMLAEERGSQR